VYDPLGLVCPFVLPAKKLIQELWRRGACWDEHLLESEICEWDRWQNDLGQLKLFSVDRCFKPSDFGAVASSEIHHFCDASESGYGSVAYMRQVDEDGRIHCVIVEIGTTAEAYYTAS
jgi:hypothetical protein